MPKNIDEAPKKELPARWKTLATRHLRGTYRPEHKHATGQLLFALNGVMLVESGMTTWVIPPRRALWIPPHCTHTVKVLSDTDLRTVYFSPQVIEQCTLFVRAAQLHVVEATDLIKELVLKIFEAEHENTVSLAIHLLLHVLSETDTLPTDVPMPTNERLRLMVQAILDQNAWDLPLSTLAQMAAMSERTLTRKFQDDTGMSLRSWKQRARVCISLNLLAAGKSVKQVASELGFSGGAAYVAAFKGVLGRTPSEFYSPN